MKMTHTRQLCRMLCAIVLLVAPAFAQHHEDDERQRIAYYLEALPKGNAEKAMRAYHEWLSSDPQARSLPLDGSVDFNDLTDAQRQSIRTLMDTMYAAAGDGAKAFKAVALILDKGLANPSEDYRNDGLSTDKPPDGLSVLMAQARDAWIEDTIRKVAEARAADGKPIKVCRSDSGNTTSGMKSDLDQTFYVYEWDEAKQDWVRPHPIEAARAADAAFIAEFESRWATDFATLDLARLDIASIAGANRFPDVRITDVDAATHAKNVRQTIVELRLTPGAYTTYGAVLQQMQLRALGGILAAAESPDDMGKRRAFQQYTDDGKILYDDEGKLIGFDDQLALRTMFGEGLDPTIRQGMAFGAAVANFIELQHYMNDPKFESKYHLRTWDDAEFTHRLVEQGAGADDKEDYTKLTDTQRADFNRQMLERLFPGDAAAQTRHALALNASAALRNVHKGAIENIEQFKDMTREQFDALSDFEKKRPVFEALSRELFPDDWAEVDAAGDAADMDRVEKLIFDAEQQHRQLASEFCMRSICENSREMLGLMFDLDADKPLIVDPEKVRAAVQGARDPSVMEADYDKQWESIRDNLAAEARETMLFAFYDLGEAEAQKLRDYLRSGYADHPDLVAKIDKLYEDSKRMGWDSFWEFKGAYARFYARATGDYVSRLNRQVHRHVLSELGFDHVETMQHAGRWLSLQGTTWNFRKFARNAIWDPGSFDAAAQIWRSVYESSGDIDVVMDRIADELFLAIPIIGQIESVRRGGYFGAGMMVLAMQVPQVGVIMIAYSMGEAYYAVYDMEYVRPKRENVVDAVFRGFTGPERIEYGTPGRLPPVWNDSDDILLQNLQTQLRAQTGGSGPDLMGATRAASDTTLAELRKRIEELEARRTAFRAYRDEDANWYGGNVTGEGAFNEFHALEHYILADVDPQVAFLSRTTLDRRVIEQYQQLEANRAQLTAAMNNASDVMAALEASRQLHELNLLKRRHDETVAGLAKLTNTAELRYRFKRDSLYLYLRDKYGELDDEKINRWTYVWYRQNETAVIEELIGIGLLDASARDWRQRSEQAVTQAKRDRVANSRTGIATPLTSEQVQEIVETYRPVNMDLLKQRVRDEVERSRRLVQAYEQLEADRRAVLDRNMDQAQSLYGREMARPGADRLAVEGGIRDLLAGVRYFAVPRRAPHVEMTVYKIPPAEEPSASASTYNPENVLANLYISADISVDPTLYHAPYRVVATLLAIDSKAKTVDTSGATLLDATKQTIDDLLPLVFDADRDDTDDEWLASLPTIREGESDWNVLLLSAYSAGMADLSNAMEATIAHLPQIKNNDGYLMDQGVWFIRTPPPPPPPVVPEYWYKVVKFPLAPTFYQDLAEFPPIVRLKFHDDGRITGVCDFKLQQRDSSPNEYHAQITGTWTDIADSSNKTIELTVTGTTGKGSTRVEFTTTTFTGVGRPGAKLHGEWTPGGPPLGEIQQQRYRGDRMTKEETKRLTEWELEPWQSGAPGTATWESDIGTWQVNTLSYKNGRLRAYEGIVELNGDNLLGEENHNAQIAVVRGGGTTFNLFEGSWNVSGRLHQNEEDESGQTWEAQLFTGGYIRPGQAPRRTFSIRGVSF